MTDSDWTDTIVSDRMTVDQEFDERVRASEFSNQEWGLIMTATELDIEHADDPERAQLVADTERLPDIMPELEKVRSGGSAMGGSGPGGSEETGGGGSGGLVDSIKGALGLGGGGERLQAAERLAQEYADELQSHLERRGKWEQVRNAYRE